MAHLSIIVFGNLAIDTRFIIELFGASHDPFGYPFCSVFETHLYGVAIDNQPYWLHHTASIPSSRMDRSLLPVANVSKNLYFLIYRSVEVRLLIYVICMDKPTSSNFIFFYNYLCQQDVPIILVQSTHTSSELSWFDLVLTLDGADPESDKVNLHKAITKHVNRKPKLISHADQFKSAARRCWKLLGKEASWSLADFHDFLKLPFKEAGWFTEKKMDVMCERIIKPIQMSLQEQSAIEHVSVGDDIQQRVDAILSTIIAADNVTPIPFLSVATESIRNISETVQVCATAIDLRS
jgi:hypothetical protein